MGNSRLSRLFFIPSPDCYDKGETFVNKVLDIIIQSKTKKENDTQLKKLFEDVCQETIEV